VKDGPTVALPAVGATADKVLAHCRTQAAQPFLIRSSFVPIGAHKAEHDATIKYRTEQYGKVEGFGLASWNPRTPESQSENVTFMGQSVRMHHKVVPALRCAEAAIKKSCAAFPYTPEHLAGIRYKNTYRGGEVTNHLFSIAIDVDPHKNSCCGCTKPWSDAPLCKKKTASVYDKMAMPECWVKAFEKYGWYWLGHDTLQDTMHFEFLGDPLKITK
ncbi:MAG: M15 family metallopeptidase, partial [Polyangiales bacterium]